MASLDFLGDVLLSKDVFCMIDVTYDRMLICLLC